MFLLELKITYSTSDFGVRDVFGVARTPRKFCLGGIDPILCV